MNRTPAPTDWTRTPARTAAAIALLLLTGALALATAPIGHVSEHAGALPVRTVDVNTASAAELELLPRVGPKLAQSIINFRTEHGPFDSLEALDAVPNIGPRTLEDLTPFVRFSAPPQASDR